MIKISGIHFSYSNRKILNGVSISLTEGKIYGVIGINGSGKTTLFNCIAGIYRHHGAITSPYKKFLKKITGYVEAEPYFFPKIIGKEYLTFCCKARDIALSDYDQNQLFDLPLGNLIETYSTGMKKKLAIMAVLMQKNHFFLFDEPFNGVDLVSSIKIKEVFRKLKFENRYILISSHALPILIDICDNILLLENGKIVENFEKKDFSKLERRILKG